MALRLEQHANFVAVLSASASKELGVESSLAAIAAKWGGLSLDMEPHRGTWRLRGAADVFAALEDDGVTLAAMKAGSHIAVFAQQVVEWEGRLARVSEALEAVLQVRRSMCACACACVSLPLTCFPASSAHACMHGRCTHRRPVQVQHSWSYLENIFLASEDIRRQLPQEAAAFDTVHHAFVRQMAKLRASGSVLSAASALGTLAAFQVRRFYSCLCACVRTWLQRLHTHVLLRTMHACAAFLLCSARLCYCTVLQCTQCARCRTWLAAWSACTAAWRRTWRPR